MTVYKLAKSVDIIKAPKAVRQLSTMHSMKSTGNVRL